MLRRRIVGRLDLVMMNFDRLLGTMKPTLICGVHMRMSERITTGGRLTIRMN